jgi:hypothetical protein
MPSGRRTSNHPFVTQNYSVSLVQLSGKYRKKKRRTYRSFVSSDLCHPFSLRHEQIWRSSNNLKPPCLQVAALQGPLSRKAWKGLMGLSTCSLGVFSCLSGPLSLVTAGAGIHCGSTFMLVSSSWASSSVWPVLWLECHYTARSRQTFRHIEALAYLCLC